MYSFPQSSKRLSFGLGLAAMRLSQNHYSEPITSKNLSFHPDKKQY
jgi:hypothetical protein